MDITTLIGIVVGTFLIVNGIGTDKLGNFVDKSSILIVEGPLQLRLQAIPCPS